MDPLSITASIIAIIQLAESVVGYLSDVKNTSRDKTAVAVEIQSVKLLLTSLKSRVQEAQSRDAWFNEIRRLGDKEGPLNQFESILTQLASMVEPGRGIKKTLGTLTWSLNKTEVSGMLSRIERVKAHVIYALGHDNL